MILVLSKPTASGRATRKALSVSGWNKIK